MWSFLICKDKYCNLDNNTRVMHDHLILAKHVQKILHLNQHGCKKGWSSRMLP